MPDCNKIIMYNDAVQHNFDYFYTQGDQIVVFGDDWAHICYGDRIDSLPDQVEDQIGISRQYKAYDMNLYCKDDEKDRTISFSKRIRKEKPSFIPNSDEIHSWMLFGETLVIMNNKDEATLLEHNDWNLCNVIPFMYEKINLNQVPPLP